MSQWLEIKTQIKSLESLKKACKENDISYIEEPLGDIVAKITDNLKGGPRYSRIAHVCKKDNYFVIKGDTDPHYSSLAARLGSDFGKLIQSYAKYEILNNVRASGGVLTEQNLKADGSLILRISL